MKVRSDGAHHAMKTSSAHRAVQKKSNRRRYDNDRRIDELTPLDVARVLSPERN